MRRLLFSVALSAAFLFAPVVHAQSPRCGPYDRISEVIKSKYQEEVRGVGVTDPRHVVMTYVSAEGTWTILVVDADGMACVIAAGEDWSEVSPGHAGR